MLTRGIIGVFALSACAAGAVNVAVGPAVGYGTPVDDRALTQITPHGYEVWKVNRDFTLDVEGTMNAKTVAALEARGHKLESVADPYMDFGSGQFIWRLSDDADLIALN